MQRWQAAKPLHETGVVSRVPRSARRTQVLETDNNTDQSAAHTDNEGNQQEQGMRNLNYELKQLCYRNRDGSYATQADR